MESLTSSGHFGTRAWLICGVLLLATMLNYMDRQALAVTLPTLKNEFSLTESRVGMVEGCFGYAFAFGSILFGLLADRWGPRWLYPIVLIGWSLAGIATAGAGQTWITDWFESSGDLPGTGTYRWLLLCRVVLGVFEAGHWPCALLTVRAILPPQGLALGNGILQSGASIGAVAVPLYIEAAERSGFTWEFPFWSIGLVGLVWVPLWLVVVRDQELRLPLGYSIPSKPLVGDRRLLVRRLGVLVVVIASLTISWQFLRAWLGLFLQDYHGYSKLATRGIMSAYFIVADVGCILSGLLVARLASRGWVVEDARRLGYLIFSLLAVGACLVPFAGSGALMVTLLLVAGAGILGLHPYYYAFTQELSAKRMGILSGGLAAWGWVASSLWQIRIGSLIEQTRSYGLGLVIVGLVPLAGCLVLFLFWPRSQRDVAKPIPVDG
ncbi:MFS transporter [Tautonia rosea]|uniref:MFS transporter n=1 Tax=Tautonia rosea TaxID=2728037 RepID=UPI0014728268|nr:MFS transporter [Tautonia rosea]